MDPQVKFPGCMCRGNAGRPGSAVCVQGFRLAKVSGSRLAEEAPLSRRTLIDEHWSRIEEHRRPPRMTFSWITLKALHGKARHALCRGRSSASAGSTMTRSGPPSKISPLQDLAFRRGLARPYDPPLSFRRSRS